MATKSLKRRGACPAVRYCNVLQPIRSCLRILWEFCSFTSLHGIRNLVSDVRYLDKPSTKKRFSKKQRAAAVGLSMVTWGGAFVVGASFALIMINLVYQRFQTTPTITTVETYYYPIWNVQFPAVTICNFNKVYRPATKNIEQKLLANGVNATQIEFFFTRLSGLVRALTLPDQTLLTIFEILEKMGYTTEKLLRELMQPCGKMLYSCAWLNEEYPCDKLFHVSKGSEGFCCSFNYNAVKKLGKLFRVSGAGDYVGLEFMLAPEIEQSVSLTRPIYGFSLIVHNTYDFVDMPPNVAIIQPGFYVKGSVTPSVLVTDEAVRTLSLAQRKCLFPDEHESLLQDEYRYVSCMTDCRMNAILKRCQCIPFYYPHVDLPAYAEYRQCAMKDIRCLRDARKTITSIRPPSDTLGFQGENETGLECDCMPGCFEDRYDLKMMMADRERSPKSDKLLTRDYKNLTVERMVNHTMVSVCFNAPTCIKYRRSLYMTWDGFFASFGGIFGLCLGGSVVSLVELIYFVIVRIFGRMLLLMHLSSRPKDNEPSTERSINNHRLFTISRSSSNRNLNSKYSNNFLQ